MPKKNFHGRNSKGKHTEDEYILELEDHGEEFPEEIWQKQESQQDFSQNKGKRPEWCHSEHELPRPRMKGKTRFHKPRLSPVQCGCGNYKCQCGTSPALEAIEDEREKETKKLALKSKPTNASVLRDASILLKEDQKQQQRILSLLSAPKSYFEYEKYLEDLRDEQEKEALIELEKKHLSGQLSYEEAILAKKRVMENNAKKREEYLEEKAALEEELQVFREQELAKLKDLVKDVHEQHEKAKAMHEKAVKSKQKLVQKMNKEMKERIKLKIKERELEIEKKIAAIKEFKILQQIKREELNSKEEKMSKLINVSIEELKARLAVYKKHMREELIKKKNRILRQKYRQEMLKTAATKFIREVKKCRTNVKKLNSSIRVNLETFSRENANGSSNGLIFEDEQLKALRFKLQEAKMKRQSFQGKNT